MNATSAKPRSSKRLRFGLSTLFVVVVIVSAMFAGGREIIRRHRVDTYRFMIGWHQMLVRDFEAMQIEAGVKYHKQMVENYEFAAKNPWLPLRPRPPENVGPNRLANFDNHFEP